MTTSFCGGEGSVWVGGMLEFLFEMTGARLWGGISTSSAVSAWVLGLVDTAR